MIINDINSPYFIEGDTIKLAQLFEDEITFYVPKVKRHELFSKIINYIIGYSKYSYSYFFFGYHIYDVDIDKYIEMYPDLSEEHGFIKIKKNDLLNTDFVSNILLEYQMASLYINDIPDLDKKYTFPIIRDFGHKHYDCRKDQYMSSIITGYSIKQWEGDYVTITRTDDCLQWNINKMNIMMYYNKIKE